VRSDKFDTNFWGFTHSLFASTASNINRKECYLQRLATNEIRPPADFTWDTFFPGQLFTHALSK
jgi:hypothetical protein